MASTSTSDRSALRRVLRRAEKAADTVRANAGGTANAGSRRTVRRATADQTRGGGLKAPGPTSNRCFASNQGASITVRRPYEPLPGAAAMRSTTSFCSICLLYTSDAADERSSVDLGGRRIIK